MSEKSCFPFCEIIGQEDMKEALILNLINPNIGGVLIDGEGGCAKSLICESLRTVSDKRIVKLPLNISEDRLIGSVDIEKTMKDGKTRLEKGVLSLADGQILFIDDVALLPDNITDVLISVLSTGSLRIERDGISDEQECKPLIIGTMNSKKVPLRKSLTDHFGLYAKAESLEAPQDRLEIMRIRDEYDTDSSFMNEERQLRLNELKEGIRKAREKIKEIVADEDILKAIAGKVIESNAEGHRADMIMKETVKAVAAFHDRTEITEDDIEEAAYFVLPHRMRPGADPKEEEPEPREDEEREDENPEEDSNNNEQNNNQESDSQEQNTEPDDTPRGDTDEENQDSGESRFKTIPKAFETGEAFQVKDFSHGKDKRTRKGSGRRTQTKTESTSGRYIYPTMNRRNNDLALDATIRAAAPFQNKRKGSGMKLVIKNEDIREKVRQKKISNLLVFVVDASGSMGAVKRMTEAKAAVLSLLKDAYVKRDKVGMVTFSGEGAQVVLPPTRSTERGYKLLEEIKTGGKTPLNAGIEKGLRVVENQLRANPDIMPMLIVITDGRGNISIDSSKKPAQELMDIGEMISKEKRLETMVIDIENNSLTSFGIAGKLAAAMKAKYFRLDEIKGSQIEAIVRREKAQ